MNTLKNTLAAIAIVTMPAAISCAKSATNSTAAESTRAESMPGTPGKIINASASVTIIPTKDNPSQKVLTAEEKQMATEFAHEVTNLEATILQQIGAILKEQCNKDIWHLFAESHAEEDPEGHVTLKAKAMIELKAKPSEEVEKCMAEVLRQLKREVRNKDNMKNLECILSDDSIQKGNSEEDPRLKSNLYYKPVGLDCTVN